METEYTGREFSDLVKQLSGKQLKKALRQAYRREGKKLREIAVASLRHSGLKAHQSVADLEKGVRAHVYTRGGGLMITVKPYRNRTSVYTNRRGMKKPVLMWAEEGTWYRVTKSKTKWGLRQRRGHRTGRMLAYHFMRNSEDQIISVAETDLARELEHSLDIAVKKAGW